MASLASTLLRLVKGGGGATHDQSADVEARLAVDEDEDEEDQDLSGASDDDDEDDEDADDADHAED